MKLSVAEICRFTESTPSSRNFVEGEKVLHAGHVIFCGKEVEDETCIKIIGFCMQTSSLRDKPHEIRGQINFQGVVQDIVCSCKAGLGKKCKHVVAVLFRLCMIDIRSLEIASCTDKKCLWSEPHSRALENYEAAPLRFHKCFTNSFDKEYALNITDEDNESIRNMLYNCNLESALSKHKFGRHDPKVPDPVVNNSQTNNPRHLQALLENLPSACMIDLSQIQLPETIKQCCELFLSRLSTDIHSVCENTQQNVKKWREERKFRITGSRCYGIFTYTKNKNPHWEEKSIKYFHPKAFKATEAIKHGIQNEEPARQAYANEKEVDVIKFGLIISTQNPWLAYSPDGVVFKDGKPDKLIEIKCPYAGKKNSVEEILTTLKYIKLPERTLKEKHEYYGQVQLGMAILNLKTTDFIIYASFDKSFIVISVELNLPFVQKMLHALKIAYFCHMIHHVCIEEGL